MTDTFEPANEAVHAVVVVVVLLDLGLELRGQVGLLDDIQHFGGPQEELRGHATLLLLLAESVLRSVDLLRSSVGTWRSTTRHCPDMAVDVLRVMS